MVESMVSVTDYERALVKLRAFEMLEGWGVLLPLAIEMSSTSLREGPYFGGEHRKWNLTERMAKADELAAWALSPCKAEEAEGE
jgi:hypothetical protein